MRAPTAALLLLGLSSLLCGCAVASPNIGVLDVEPVPEAAAPSSSRQLLQATGSTAAPGGYGGDSRRLQQGGYGSADGRRLQQGGYGASEGRRLQQGAPGGYGGDSRRLQQGGYGGAVTAAGSSAGRRLTAEAASSSGSTSTAASPTTATTTTAPVAPRDPLLEYAEQQLAAQDQRLMAEQAAAGGLSAAAVAALSRATRATTSSAAALKRSAGSGAGSSSSSTSSGSAGSSLPAGQCYCRYDMDFHTWALAEEPCKQALYRRCQTEASLDCSWLDRYYAPMKGPGHSLPHEADIAAFVAGDCTPQPPCACAGISFGGGDPVAATVACCRDLQVACRAPSAGLSCEAVADFCVDDSAAPGLAGWTRSALQHGSCASYRGGPYNFTPLRDMLAASPHGQQAQRTAADEAQMLKQALLSLQAQLPTEQQAQPQHSTVVALAAVAAGAVCVAVAAVVFALRKEKGAAWAPTDITTHAAGLRAIAIGADVQEPLLRQQGPETAAGSL